MSEGQLYIEARVDEREYPGMRAAAQQLSECLGRGAGLKRGFVVKLTFFTPQAEVAPGERPSAVVVSLLPELLRPEEPMQDVTARWVAYVKARQASGAPVYVRNIFRNVRDRSRDGRPTPLLERIRGLNRMALEVSRETGAAIIDVDRALAHIGASELQADFTLQGALAAEVSAHTTVQSFLSYGMDDTLDPALQEKARAIHGSLNDAYPAMRRRAGHAEN